MSEDENNRPWYQRRKWGVWFSGIGNGFISGGATAVCAALGISTANMFGASIPPLTLGQLGQVIFWGSISGGAMYLKQSPWPREEDATKHFKAPPPPNA